MVRFFSSVGIWAGDLYNTAVLPQVMVCTGWRRNNLLQCRMSSVRWYIASLAQVLSQCSESRPRGSWAALQWEPTAALHRPAVYHSISWNRRHTVPDWNLEFLKVCATQEALSSMWWCCLQPFMTVCLSAKEFLCTLPALTSARAKTTSNYIEKSRAVTADSLMVDFSTLNPVFWGFTQCAQTCFWVLCGVACLGFCVHRFHSERKLAIHHKAAVKKKTVMFLKVKALIKNHWTWSSAASKFRLILFSFGFIPSSNTQSWHLSSSQTPCFPRRCESNISHLLIHSLHLPVSADCN